MTEDDMASRWPGWRRATDVALEAGASDADEVIRFARANRLPVLHVAPGIAMVPSDTAERLKAGVAGAKS